MPSPTADYKSATPTKTWDAFREQDGRLAPAGPQLQSLARLSSDEQFAFVEGMECALPVAELAVQNNRPTTTSPIPLMSTTTSQAPLNPFFTARPPEEDDLAIKGDAAKERTTLDEGPAVLVLPDNLSQASVEELEYWLKGIIRRARRKAGMEASA